MAIIHFSLLFSLTCFFPEGDRRLELRHFWPERGDQRSPSQIHGIRTPHQTWLSAQIQGQLLTVLYSTHTTLEQRVNRIQLDCGWNLRLPCHINTLGTHFPSQKEMSIEAIVVKFTFFWYFWVFCVDPELWYPWALPTFFNLQYRISTGGSHGNPWNLPMIIR